MSIVNFTVTFDALASEPDSADTDIEADTISLIGEARFTPQFADDRFVLAPDYSPRPAGFKPRTFVGYIDTDGRLKASSGGPVGVRLWANDPVFDLGGDPLIYKVDFDLRTPLGEPVPVESGYFTAPTDDSVVNLADVLQSSLALAAGAPGITGGYFDEAGDVVFENADGSFVAPIDIPAGTLVFVDNGDSTWSVG